MASLLSTTVSGSLTVGSGGITVNGTSSVSGIITINNTSSSPYFVTNTTSGAAKIYINYYPSATDTTVTEHYIQATSTGLTTGQDFRASSFYASSDRRLKENIKMSSLDFVNIIKSIKLRDFTWKSDSEHKKQFGLIAQELQKVLPDEYISAFIGSGDILSINDGKVGYLAVGGVQDLIKKNEKLEKKVKSLEEKNKELEKRLLKLEKLVNNLL